MQGFTHLDECLDDFFKKESLSGDNQYACDACRSKTDAERGIELLELPAVLHLQLMRFVYDMKSNSRKKIQSPMTFPKTLDLTKYCTNLREEQNDAGVIAPCCGGASGVSGQGQGAFASSHAKGAGKKRKGLGGGAGTECCDKGILFDLESVVLHSGNKASEGHYIAHVRDAATRQWWRFDDGYVSSLKDDDFFGTDEAILKANKKRKDKEAEELRGKIKSKEAYMLIYRRRGAGGQDKAIPVPEELAEPIRLRSQEVMQVRTGMGRFV